MPGRRLLALADNVLDLFSNLFEVYAQRLKRLRGNTLTLVNQTEQDVLSSDVVVV